LTGNNASTVNSQDSGLTGLVVSTLSNGAWVTDALSGTTVQIPFCVINPDNTIGNPNEYYLYLLMGNPTNFGCQVAFDLSFVTNSSNVTFSINA
jgi:hypothetical protein